MQMLPHIFNGNGTISIMIDGKMKPVDTAHKYYEEIKQAIKDKEWDKIPKLVNIKESVEEAINASTTAGSVTIKDGQIFYNDIRIHNSLTARIVDMAKDGFDIGYMVKFLENLMQNPSHRAVNELYDFLEAGSIPITEDGMFLTYKKIKNDWTDIYTGTFDNSIGAEPEMPRNMVDEDADRTCSNGLHVCSYNYLPHFSSASDDRVVVCQVCPSAVVAIPKDYNNTKMRVCKYKVIAEIKDYKESDLLAQKAVIFTSDIKQPIETPKSGGCRIKEDNVDEIELGLQVEENLNQELISGEDVINILKHLKVADHYITELSHYVNTDAKRTGKKIVKFIKAGLFTTAAFSIALNDFLSNQQLLCKDPNGDHETRCDRCGSSNIDSDGECLDCGYYQI